MPVNVSALRVELLTDPKGLGYSTFVTFRDLNRLVDLLNTRGLTSEVVSIGTITSMDLQANVVGSEYVALTAAQRNLWDVVIFTGTGGIAISNTNVRGQITAVWSAATTTRANLVALQNRPASRAEVLFGENTLIQTGEVDQATR